MCIYIVHFVTIRGPGCPRINVNKDEVVFLLAISCRRLPSRILPHTLVNSVGVLTIPL